MRCLLLFAWVLASLLRSAAVVADSPDPALRSVEVRLDLQAEAEGRLEGAVRLVSTGEEQEERLALVDSSGRALVELAVDTRWRVCAAIPGWWAPCAVLVVDSGSGRDHEVLKVWPTGRLGGRVRLSRDEGELPGLVTVGFRSPSAIGRKSAIAASAQECPVSEEGLWSCELPAAALDIVIRAQGFVPHRLWDVEIPRDGLRDLRVLELRGGASVAAWVQLAPAGEEQLSAASARLFPFVPHGPRTAAGERASRTVGRSSVLDNGFLQVGPVEVGTYVLSVTHPGYSTVRVFPLALGQDQEVFLRDPIVLRLPLSITVDVEPATDWLDRPWQVLLTPASQLSGVSNENSGFRGVTQDGRALAAAQSPGLFRLEIRDSLGESFYFRSDLVVETEEDASVLVELEVTTIRGLVRLGGEPVQAEIWFGGRRGVPSVALESDLKGKFVGVLPRDGWWHLELEAASLDLDVESRVEVRADESGEAFVEINLPDTELFGRVVDEQGSSVTGARVRMSHSLGNVGATTEEDGAFEFRAFEPGPVSIQAQAHSSEGLLSSQAVIVPAVEGSPLGPMQLRLVKTRQLQGLVRSVQGTPVAGALVDLSTVTPVTAALSRSTRTKPDGSFEIDVHPDAEHLRAVVSPPGFALEVQKVRLTDPLVLSVSPEHGSLVLDLGPEAPEEQRFRQQLAVLVGGHELPLARIHNWARGHGMLWQTDGTVFEVPRVAPGNYRLCVARADLTSGAALEQGNWHEGLTRCTEGFLSPGGELRLQLPSAESGGR